MLSSNRVRNTVVATTVAASSLLGASVALAPTASAAAATVTAQRTYSMAVVRWYAYGDRVCLKDNKKDKWYPQVWVKDLTKNKSYGYTWTRKGAGKWHCHSYKAIPEGHRVRLQVRMILPGDDGYQQDEKWYQAFTTHS